MATPNQMPKRTNPMHQQILSGLLANKPTSWTHKTLLKGDDGKGVVVETKVVGQEPRNALARNVSEHNIDQAARRWLR
ncbi:hypothetical protein SEA_GRUUNAGA_67 [Mycobacterium phage Gruunaga]|uniref:Uncharacterized protein n=1 Tax=Mycobacterium phage Gruunaga TaxID=1897770 RepID=A0A1C9LYV7_9CAUD|nr:hypothetical protein SEA_GRUUNAGA_67 [Mycobacterium phage Gruunaga]QYC54071.1 hypothetical protein SEA_ROKSOLANA_68 [Mycobacterium phage Roksolana]WGH21485.1 hypothetical protein SEA_TUCKER_67 [Mycobacterium phage Tucker]WRQ08635.1 hypothetical protein JDBV06_00020 [Mycobacterium phage miche]